MKTSNFIVTGLLILALCLWSGHMAFAGEISGEVTLPTGDSVRNALVNARMEYPETYAEAVTDEAGHFTLTDLIDGTWILSAEPLRGETYKTYAESLEVTAEVTAAVPTVQLAEKLALRLRNLQGDVTLPDGDIDNDDTASPVIDPAMQIQGDNSYHVVRAMSIDTADTIIDGFTITAGKASETMEPNDRGAGIYGNPEITNCTITGNTAISSGGGMYNTNGSPTITNCTFTENAATHTESGYGTGGGMYSESGRPTLANCTLSENSADLFHHRWQHGQRVRDQQHHRSDHCQ